MKIISFTNRKGGCGKSTSAVLAAAIFSQHFDMKVLVVDMDDQQSIGKQYDANVSEQPLGWDFLPMGKPMNTKQEFKAFHDYLLANEGGYDLVLLDTAGRLHANSQEHRVLEVSDLICVPIVPTGLTWADTMEYLGFVLSCELQEDTRVLAYVNQYIPRRKRCEAVFKSLPGICEMDGHLRVLRNPLHMLEELATFPMYVDNMATLAMLNAHNWASEIKTHLS